MYENQFKRKVFKPLIYNNLSSKKSPVWAFSPQNIGNRGIPDILMLWRNDIYAFELKINGRFRISSQQIIALESISLAGGFSAVVFIAEKGDKLKIPNRYEKYITKTDIVETKRNTLYFCLFNTRRSKAKYNAMIDKIKKGVK